jgi:hypothetical protein
VRQSTPEEYDAAQKKMPLTSAYKPSSVSRPVSPKPAPMKGQSAAVVVESSQPIQVEEPVAIEIKATVENLQEALQPIQVAKMDLKNVKRKKGAA